MEEIWNQNWEKKLYLPPGQSYYKIFYVNKKNGESTWGKPFDIDGNPLPKGWERVYSTKQKKYYYLHTNTNKTQFKKPLFTQNNYSPSYSPHTYSLALAKPSIPEIIDDEPHIRTLSGKDVNENQIPDYEDGNLVYRSRSGNRTYLHNLPARPHGEPETIFIHEICCDGEYTQFPSRLCAETYSHTLAAHASYILGTENKSLDGFVEIRNSKADRACPTYESFDFIRKKDPVVGYRKALKQVLLPWSGSSKPVVQDEHNLSDHDAIILNLQFEKTLENMPFNIISMNLEGLCKVKKDDRYRYIEYMNSYFDPHIKVGTIMVFQEVVLKNLANTLYSKDVLEVDEAGNQILQVLQIANPETQLEFISDTYTSGILYDTSVWNISDVRPISRLYHGKLESKFSNAYLFTSKEGSCEFWVVNIHLKAPLGTPEHKNDINEQINMSLGILDRASNHVINMHIIELNNIVRTLKEASLDFEIPVYLCGDYNNEISKGFLVKKAIEGLDDFYDPNEVKL
jgi:hypothetical protein